ncbi:MAG TPA: uroporphyrinogen-III synthase [Steroidobacteraceae bacterium]|jgi:uroporphyrinogen-III synthase|nr:uroporphyrinogen-III synthase [Steroidobacteraceae bacterium]
MRPLHGVGVLVTRPELQAMPLCRLLENQGASTLRLPALEIKALRNRRALKERLGPLERFDAIIFTSANAVRFGVSFLDQKRELTLAALGKATALALNQAGYRVAVQPHDSIDTEGLLGDPRLAHVAGHRILIVKGRDGRQLLQEELTQRGAAVTCAEVYERVAAIPSAETLAEVEERFAAGEVHVITATSLGIGESLLKLAAQPLRAEFERVHWLVPGERITSGLRALGLQAPLLMADSAEDQDLVAALIRWRSSVSGA